MILKIIIIGDCSVGKTNILRHYIRDKTENISATIAVEFSPKLAMLQNGKKVKLQIWDTSGQEQYQSITQAHYKRAVGALLVFDITSKNSFNNIQDWYDQIIQKGDENIKIILVGNKTDQNSHRQVTQKEGKDLAQKLNIEYMECSAMKGDNVDQVFSNLLESICGDNKLQSKQQAGMKLDQQSQNSGCCF